MKQVLKEPQHYFLLGIFIFILAIPRENLFINTALISICLLMWIVAITLLIKNYLDKKKSAGQEKLVSIALIAGIAFAVGSYMTAITGYSVLSACLKGAASVCALVVAWRTMHL